MSRPGIEAVAPWLQRRLGAYLFTVDHPGLAECAGAHRPGLPCDGSPGKHPCGKWSRDSTSDPGLIRAQLSRGLRNLGIDCGKSGLLVVDEDRPGAFAAFAASIGETVPLTFTVVTSKGAHSYFRQPEGEALGNSRGAMAGQDIDVRGAGGFVVAPASVHQSGIVYTPVDPAVAVAPTPDWLASVLHSPRLTPQPGTVRGAGSVNGRLRGVVAAVLDAREGTRNDVLFWATKRAAEMVDAGQLDQVDAAGILTRAGEAAGLGPAEVAATVASGLRGVTA